MTIFLACAAKSNAAYKAYNAARAFVASDGSRPVPLHLRNAPTKLMKALDYGKAYRYAHDEPEAYAAGENYLPEACKRRVGINPSRAAWSRALPRSSPICARWTARPCSAVSKVHNKRRGKAHRAARPRVKTRR